MTPEQELAHLRAENEKLRAKTATKVRPITMKVGEKRGLSVYGLTSRFPVTLYRQQWETLLKMEPEIRAFIEAHKDELAVKE